MTKKMLDDVPEVGVNEVRVVGRLSLAPEARVLPSGDPLTTFRVVVTRDRPLGRTVVDALECAAWTASARRSVARWTAGDIVEVSGALRRRFFRAGAGAQSRVEIEVINARRLRRAPAPRGAP